MFLPTIKRAITDTFKVFHHDTSCIDRFGESHQLLGSNMEEVLRYGFFLPAQSFQQTFSRRRANTSDFRSYLSDASSAIVKGTTTDIQGLAALGYDRYEQVLDPRIHTNDGSCIFAIRNIDLDSEDEEPSVADKFETRIRPITFRDYSALVLSLCSPDRQSLATDIEVTFPANGDDDLLEDGEFPLAVGFHAPVGGDNMTEQGATDLARKLEFLPDCCVELVGEACGCFHDLAVVDDVRKPVGGIAIGNADLGQLGVVCGEFQFDGSDGFHTIVI